MKLYNMFESTFKTCIYADCTALTDLLKLDVLNKTALSFMLMRDSDGFSISSFSNNQRLTCWRFSACTGNAPSAHFQLHEYWYCPCPRVCENVCAWVQNIRCEDHGLLFACHSSTAWEMGGWDQHSREPTPLPSLSHMHIPQHWDRTTVFPQVSPLTQRSLLPPYPHSWTTHHVASIRAPQPSLRGSG